MPGSIVLHVMLILLTVPQRNNGLKPVGPGRPCHMNSCKIVDTRQSCKYSAHILMKVLLFYLCVIREVMLRITILAAGFVIGPSGVSVREIMRQTNADIKSWTDDSHRQRRQCRIFVVAVSQCMMILPPHCQLTYLLSVIEVNLHSDDCTDPRNF